MERNQLTNPNMPATSVNLSGRASLGQISDNKATGNIWLQLPEKAGLDLPTKRLLNAWPTETQNDKLLSLA